jgi:hypothetical protein
MTKYVIKTSTIIAKIFFAITKLLISYRLKALAAIAKASGLKFSRCDGLPLQKYRELIGK